MLAHYRRVLNLFSAVGTSLDVAPIVAGVALRGNALVILPDE